MLENLRITSGDMEVFNAGSEDYFSSIWIASDCMLKNCSISAFQGTNIVVDSGSIIVETCRLAHSPFYCFALKNEAKLLSLLGNEIYDNEEGLFHPCQTVQDENIFELNNIDI